MAICYESTQIGEVRADAVSAAPGVGVSLLQFSLTWSLHPKREETYSVFGTYLRASVAPQGAENALYLGHALPEVAWTEETRPGIPVERPLMYQLPLHAAQLLSLEQMREGRDLIFTLDLRGNALGPRGIRQIAYALQLRVPLSAWVHVLRDAQAADILLVGVDIPLTATSPAFSSAFQLVRQAYVFQIRGEYAAAVSECRRALESMWKVGKLEDEARAARKLLSGTMDDRRSMGKKEREVELGEALINFDHPAHHVGNSGDAEIFGRQDAALAVATAAALIGSIAQMSRQS